MVLRKADIALPVRTYSKHAALSGATLLEQSSPATADRVFGYFRWVPAAAALRAGV